MKSSKNIRIISLIDVISFTLKMYNWFNIKIRSVDIMLVWLWIIMLFNGLKIFTLLTVTNELFDSEPLIQILADLGGNLDYLHS